MPGSLDMEGGRGFWERQGSAFFHVKVCYPNAESYNGLTTKQIYHQHESEKKIMYASRGLEAEQDPLPHWYLLPPEEWQMNARGITVDWLNFYQPRRERITALQSHGFALIRPPEFCATMLERLTFYAKTSPEHYR